MIDGINDTARGHARRANRLLLNSLPEPSSPSVRCSLDMDMAAIPVFAQDQATVVKEVQVSFIRDVSEGVVVSW